MDEQLDKAQIYHHECQPSERLTKLERFRDSVRALLAELDGENEEVALNECFMRRLEAEGKIKARKDYE